MLFYSPQNILIKCSIFGNSVNAPSHIKLDPIQEKLLKAAGQLGGLTGVCIGFSLMSVVEIVYWFTIRVVTKHKKGA